MRLSPSAAPAASSIIFWNDDHWRFPPSWPITLRPCCPMVCWPLAPQCTGRSLRGRWNCTISAIFVDGRGSKDHTGPPSRIDFRASWSQPCTRLTRIPGWADRQTLLMTIGREGGGDRRRKLGRPRFRERGPFVWEIGGIWPLWSRFGIRWQEHPSKRLVSRGVAYRLPRCKRVRSAFAIIEK